MQAEDLNLLSQLIESMSLAIGELEKALERKDVEKMKETKKEILNFQKQITKFLVKRGE